MIKSRSIGLMTFFLALSVFRQNPVLAQLTKINVGYSAISGDALPAWVAKDAGIFKSQVEALNRIYTDKEASLRALARFIGRNVERDILEKTWENLLSESVLLGSSILRWKA